MTKRVQRLGHTTALADAFTGLARELTIDTSLNEIRVHDGFTAGGHSMARADASNLQAATAAQNGKMTSTQVTELTAATAQIATNVTGIATNVTNIATNAAAITANGVLAATKAALVSSPVVGRIVTVDTGGELSQDSKLAADVPTIKSGVVMLFLQAAAPDGWTLDVTNNDRVIRINSTAGAATGGAWPISGLSTLAEGAHTHTFGGTSSTNSTTTSGDPSTIGKNFGGASHTHTYSGTTSAVSTTHSHTVGADGAWRPAYVDVIACTRDA